jgi:alpha-L-fucosidase
MLDLAVKYETEIMWCDIGGPNKALEFAAKFYNNALANKRQVTMNNSEAQQCTAGWFWLFSLQGCGAVPDFDTPEYATFGSTQTQAWESSEGMDPFSYGLNSATLPNQYKNGTTIVQTLVDIVSKNGNLWVRSHRFNLALRGW